MKNNFKKILSFLLVFIITFSSSIPVFAENRANSHYFNLLNVQSSKSENVNEEVKKIFPYGEIVGKVETKYGTAYYVDRFYNSPMKPRTIWDALDVVMAGASWAEFFNEPSLANLGWAALDTVALLPALPSSAYFRKGGKLLLNVDEVKKISKTSDGLSKIKKALKPAKVVEESSELVRIAKLAKNYFLNDKTFKHILTEHGHNSIKYKSKFKKGFDIKDGIRKVLTTDSVIKNNTKNRDGYIFIKEFGETIGYDGKKSLSKLKVVLSESGGVITAYPIE